jgi:hypothetical protein
MGLCQSVEPRSDVRVAQEIFLSMNRRAACFLIIVTAAGCGSEHARDLRSAELGEDGGVETIVPSPSSPLPAGEPTATTSSEDASTPATVDPTPPQVDPGTTTTGGADAGDAGSPPPPGPAVCGDNKVDPGESCDPGSGFAGPACSYYCDTLDFLPITGTSSTSASRTLGGGRHPLAASPNGDFSLSYIETVNGNVAVKLAPLDVHGNPRGAPVTLATGAQAQAEADPVVAALSGSSYVAAWTGFVDGDELGVALRVVDPSAPGTSPVVVANTASTVGSQASPDLIVTAGGKVIVAWVDMSAGSPDVKLREFSPNLTPTSGERVVAASDAAESDVSLAPFGNSYAVAWRSALNGAEEIHARTGNTEWTMALETAGPAGDRPALAELDATHLLLVYSEGMKLRAAVLDVASPGPALSVDVPGATAGAQSQPNAIRAAGEVYVAWRVAGTPGDANGEDVVIRAVRLGAGGGLEFTAPEMPMPRGEHRRGDQRAPALAAGPIGVLVSGWDDLGRNLGNLEWNRDVVLNVAAVPLVRGGDVAATVDLERFPGRERALYCKHLGECCLHPETFDEARCESLAGAGWGNINVARSAFGDGHLFLSKAQADRCMRETAAVDCSVLRTADYVRWTHACASAIVGVIPMGGSGCHYAFECPSDAYCDSAGVCRGLKREGETCTEAGECMDRAVAGAELYCSGTAAAPGVCTRTLAEGATCGGSLQCSGGICRVQTSGQKSCVSGVTVADPGVVGGICDQYTVRPTAGL